MNSKYNLTKSHFFSEVIWLYPLQDYLYWWLCPFAFQLNDLTVWYTQLLSNHPIWPATASSYAFPVVYVYTENSDHVLHLLFPSHFWYTSTVLIFQSKWVNPAQMAPSSISGDIHFCLCYLGLYRQWRLF